MTATTDTTDIIERNRAALEKATPGPWSARKVHAAHQYGRGNPGRAAYVLIGAEDVDVGEDTFNTRADMRFAAQAHNDLPRILAMLERAVAWITEERAITKDIQFSQRTKRVLADLDRIAEGRE